MDPFTLTDDKGTAVFDGNTLVISPADGSTAVTYTTDATSGTPAVTTVSLTQNLSDGLSVVFNPA